MVRKLIAFTQDHESNPVTDWVIFTLGALSLATALTAAFIMA